MVVYSVHSLQIYEHFSFFNRIEKYAPYELLIALKIRKIRFFQVFRNFKDRMKESRR